MADNYFKFSDTVNVSDEDVKDIFKRIVFKGKFFDDNSSYDDFKVMDGMTPESVARNIYGSASLYWVILLSNGMQDFLYDWPILDDVVRKIASKYYADGNFDTGQDEDDIYAILVDENNAKRDIKYLKKSRLSELIFELNKSL